MSWENLDLNSVVDTQIKAGAIEPGSQIVRLLGTKPDTYQPDALAFDLVVDEGGYKNRRIFPTLPDPAKYGWSANAAKHLAKTIGVDQQPGESVIQMFNRAATNGSARFSVQVTKETFTRNDGTPGEKNNIQWFSASAVA